MMIVFAVGCWAQTAANWTRQIPQAFPSPRVGPVVAYDSLRHQVVLFGGSNNSTNYTDTWIWDGANWTQKFPQTSPPVDFYGMVFDSARNQILLVGTTTTWVWDGTNWSQKFPQTSPPPRAPIALAFDAAHGQAALFGGANRGLFNDTWVWDGSNWTQKFPQTRPSARYQHGMAYDAVHNQVVMFGGNDGSFFSDLSDTWVWDGTNWSQKSPSTSPSARVVVRMTFDSAHSEVLLFGGEDANLNLLNDTWTWNGVNWTQKSPQTSPQARSGLGLTYDSAHGQVVLFGGANGTTALGDTWTWNGGSTASQPSIAAVINASAYGGSTTVAPGSWVEIYGTGLSANTRQWGGADFTGNSAPTSLDGVQVSIGGQKAFVDYISSLQVNAQLPSSISTGGSLPVTVTNGGQVSATFNVAVKPTSAALLAPASFQIGGKQYLVALLPDNATYILPPGAISGVPSRQAHPGETIVTYGIGFGTVNPSTDAGQIVTQTNQLTAPLQILFGQTPAQVPYAGLAPGYVGLYQFNIVVPAVPDNDLTPLSFNLGGVAGTQTLYIAVHQ